MPRRPALLILALLSLAAPACAKPSAHTQTPALAAPEQIVDLADYSAARNAFAMLPTDGPERAELRAELRDYLIRYVDRALAEDRDRAALEGLGQLAGLWTPAELHAGVAGPEPELAATAWRVYEAVAPAGDEDGAMIAIALAQRFGDEAIRTEAETAFEQLRDWLVRGQEFSADPYFGSELTRLLETASSILPSPFIADALADVYLSHYRAAQRDPRGASDPRVAFTGYLVARAYLAADDPDAAIAAIDRLEVDESTTALRELIADATRAEGRTAADLAQLTREFVPTPDNQLPEAIVRQSWVIVDNLARRALALDRGDPPANLARGRVLRSRGLDEAAILHYERAFASKARPTDREDLYTAWTELAELYQLALEDLVFGEPSDAELDALLDRVDDFHGRAAAVWPQRPVSPGLPMAWMTVARAQFHAGDIERAEALLREAVAVEPYPLGLSLLGTIALRQGDYDEARGTLSRIPDLPFADQLERYDWQIRAGLLLAETERYAGNERASVDALRDALRQLNILIAYPGLTDLLRVEFLARRMKVFFQLGEVELAMKDFHEADKLGAAWTTLYSDALQLTVVEGQLALAEEVLAAALDNRDTDPDLRVYYSLWVVELSRRLGDSTSERAQAYLRDYVGTRDDHPAWIRKLAQHGLGELDDDVLLAAASNQRERSEALFYVGLAKWRADSRDAGLANMRGVLEQNMMGDFEYQMAQAYLIDSAD